ncbi:hypothetical protein DY000_02056281 [Brassica cretica]|uniref:Uncharacterized protein n=1 Tax=Brassica cretica TaxID=69181 RepID=A0ABQ7ABA8_BRACR|nr:hypothetical protein DY000_02056281 [Brassica cretica]
MLILLQRRDKRLHRCLQSIDLCIGSLHRSLNRVRIRLRCYDDHVHAFIQTIDLPVQFATVVSRISIRCADSPSCCSTAAADLVVIVGIASAHRTK